MNPDPLSDCMSGSASESFLRIAVREAKIEMAKRIRRENNMKDRNGGEATGSLR